MEMLAMERSGDFYMSLLTWWLLVFLLVLHGFVDAHRYSHIHGHRTISGNRALQGSDPLQRDIDALLEFNSSNSLYSNWSTRKDPCQWVGVACEEINGYRRVTGLNLTGMSLSGQIPYAVANLTELSYLSLASNSFNGSIPPELGSCSKLNSLDLAQNKLSGSIPESFGGLHSLQYLNLSSNNLTGGIPKSILQSCSLQMLNLSHNPLGGNLPTDLKNCNLLRVLDLDNCSLIGELPVEMGQMTAMQTIVLAENNLTGTIPGGLFRNCQNLQALDLSVNNLTGAVPREIGNCRQLVNFTASENRLDTLPDEIGRLKMLYNLILGQNHFSALPSQLENCSNLSVLDVNTNNFMGQIPSFFGNLKQLVFLVLHTNNFTGTIPESLMTYPKLCYLDISSNKLNGSVPSRLSAIKTLKFLFLAQNSFTGAIPSELGELTGLQMLDLSGNHLTGSLPSTVGSLQSLLWLMIENNELTGLLPSELANCTSLLWLNAAHNQLSGSLPQNLSSMGSRAADTFSYNQNIIPMLPRGAGACSVVRRWIPSQYPPFSLVASVLNRYRCHAFWDLLLRGNFIYALCTDAKKQNNESVGYIQLSNNKLSGSIPSDWGVTKLFTLLFLSENHLEGAIPETLSQLSLTALNISHNLLWGEIPKELGDLTCLQLLDLSYNNFSGRIPSELQKLTSLTKFNISYNPALYGAIPFGGQFSTFTNESYYGDINLCSNPGTGNTLRICNISPPSVPSVSNSTSKHARLKLSALIGVSLTCALAVTATGIALVYFLGKRRPYDTILSFSVVGKEGKSLPGASEQVSLFTMDLPKQLTYGDLCLATNNFDEANVVGCGGFGVVYKARLTDGSTVAVKKLIREGPRADREFLAEMETLGHLHHPNLVPLLGCFTSGSEKILVYKYIDNGSLDDWLYENVGHDPLEWPIRLKVAVDIARGLKFLHHTCSPPIIHRDLKASNILLDRNFEAKLTDFGLARIINAQETHVSTIIAGTLGYVPPEYSQSWRATIKGDVYSFGVVLLELITGRRPMDIKFSDNNGGSLMEWVTDHIKEGTPTECYHPVVSRTGPAEQLLQFLKLAISCCEELPTNRPSMQDVSVLLEHMRFEVLMTS